jgi:hypothetical protein
MSEKCERFVSKTKLFQNYFVICYPTFPFESKYGYDIFQYEKGRYAFSKYALDLH